MLHYFSPTLKILLANSFLYSIYHFANLNTRLKTIFHSAELGSFEFLLPNPLLRFYFLSLITIFTLGLIDSYLRYRKDKKEYNRKKDKQRRHYRAQQF